MDLHINWVFICSVLYVFFIHTWCVFYSQKQSACGLCGLSGHSMFRCPNRLCYNCDQSGHVSQKCPNSRRDPNMVCRRCQRKGHIKSVSVASLFVCVCMQICSGRITWSMDVYKWSQWFFFLLVFWFQLTYCSKCLCKGVKIFIFFASSLCVCLGLRRRWMQMEKICESQFLFGNQVLLCAYIVSLLPSASLKLVTKTEWCCV